MHLGMTQRAVDRRSNCNPESPAHHRQLFAEPVIVQSQAARRPRRGSLRTVIAPWFGDPVDPDESDEGQRLRSSHPFKGIITQQERLDVIARHPPPGAPNASRPIYAALHPRAIVDQAFDSCISRKRPTNADRWPIAPWTVADWIWTETQMDEVKRLARLAAPEVPARHRTSWDRWTKVLEPFKTPHRLRRLTEPTCERTGPNAAHRPRWFPCPATGAGEPLVVDESKAVMRIPESLSGPLHPKADW